MSALDREKMKAITARLDALIRGVSVANLGLAELRLGNCKYDADGGFTIQLKGRVIGGLNPEESNYDFWKQCQAELPPRGWEFEFKGERYTVYGMKPRSEKILAREVVTGRLFSFPKDAVVRRHIQTAVPM